MVHYFTIYKPFQVLSQFSHLPHEINKQTLKDFFDVPVDVYPVGRLDYDSEGLLILTNDANLNHRLLNPSFGHEREYWVQVEGAITNQAIEELMAGVEFTVDGKPFKSKKCRAEKMDDEPALPSRFPPIRFRKNIPVSWIKIVLTEGKNRQVRKMTARVGYPTLRLIRYRIGNVNIKGMEPGNIKEFTRSEIYEMLFGN